MRSRLSRVFRRTTIAATFAVALAHAAIAQDDAECLICHEDRTLIATRDGQAVPAFVDEARLSRSVHASLECVSCHTDLAGSEAGHEDDVARVDCALCHDAEAALHARSLHGRAAARGDRLAPTCSRCHGTHEILSHRVRDSRTSVMNVPLLCGQCHREGSEVSETHEISQERILENYSMSIHGEGLFKKGLTVTAVCTSCHTAHLILDHDDPESSIHRRNVAATCTACHARIEDVHRRVIEGRLWRENPNAIPSCVDCHAPHRIRNPDYQAGAANKDCLACHANRELATTKAGRQVSLFVDEQIYHQTAHASVACAQCHTDVTVSLHRPCETVRSQVDCSICHAVQVEQFNTSTHGRLLAAHEPGAPTCLTCHGKHDIKDHLLPASPTYARNVPTLCGTCHARGQVAAERRARAGAGTSDAGTPDIVESYELSVHGRALVQGGLVVTATCVDCHGPHLELPASDPASLVHRDNVAKTCGTCHHGIEETFAASIHAPREDRDLSALPTCESCHTSHQITRTDAIGFRVKMMSQCGRCHEVQAATYFDTFHGKVSRLGHDGAAKCYDCHGTHDILPPSEPDSRLSAKNIVATCAECHPGAHRRFAGYLTHATHHDVDRYPYLFWSFWAMTALLLGTLVFATTHTGAWLFRLWRTRSQWRPHVEAARASAQHYVRFTSKERAQHVVMIVSFFTLALTGMSLKFSYAPWAQWVSRVLGGFDTMGTLHRIGALVLIGLFVFHVRDLLAKKRERGQSWIAFLSAPGSLMFSLRDAKELWGSVKWFLGVGPRPSYGRFTYWEKFDYFAVFWGVFVIGSTGLVLWFPELFTYVLPGWAVNVATIIHSDEALLAVGFIFTVHFFNTHFRPDKFPMDLVMFTGRVPLEELKHDKPREYEEMLLTGELESRLAPPPSPKHVRLYRVLGFTALAIGLSLIAFIVYSMIFGYR